MQLRISFVKLIFLTFGFFQNTFNSINGGKRYGQTFFTNLRSKDDITREDAMTAKLALCRIGLCGDLTVVRIANKLLEDFKIGLQYLQ